eukprot:TRINITY_DN17012_c0_g3_i1.p1 TRINITY_DN17012_c0_g3~~TRINITY_DN17012_c0_g3_i1.p1  ORF type:complete len:548 (-),score=89.94 TRINITY_DN17012_c0_g3_i1:678-2261(-)
MSVMSEEGAEFGTFWGATEAGENQEVEHQSGASRLMGALAGACCCTPAFLLGSMILLGYNERRAVCDQKAIAAGLEVVLGVQCTSATEGDGKLVHFTCDMDQSSLSPFTDLGDFTSSLSGYKGTGLKVSAEMLQCVEKVRSETKKDNVGGGKTTIKTYSYSPEWRSYAVSSIGFKKKTETSFIANCGVENPPWPATVPTSQTLYASTMKAGPYTLEKSQISQLSLNKEVTPSSAPSGWTLSGNVAETNKYTIGSKQIGKMRVSFKGTDWAAKAVTVIAKNTGGNMGKWTAPNDWLCSGFTLNDATLGTLTKEAVFERLKAAASFLTWFLRFLGWIMAWSAFFFLAGPLEVAGDCIPCIGPWIGDFISAVACCISCLPGTACCCFVIAIVWVAMRPLVGIPLMLITLCIFIGMAVFKLKFAKKPEKEPLNKADGEAIGASNGEAETAAPPPEPQVCSAPVEEALARSFLNALRAEYLRGEEGAVGGVVDNASPEAQEKLCPFEDRVRDCEDKKAEIDVIALNWGMATE